MKKREILLGLMATLTLSACGTLSERSDTSRPLLDAQMGLASMWVHRDDGQGNPLSAAYDEKNNLVVRFPGQSERIVAPRPEGDMAAGLGVAVADGRAAVLWYEKTPRTARLLTSGAAESVHIDSEEGSDPLPQMGLEFLPDGRWQALWVGERPVEGGSMYNVYARVEGEPLQRVLPADHLRHVQLDDGSTVVFGRRPAGAAGEVQFAVRNGSESRFGEARPVADKVIYGAFFRAWASGDAWAVAWDERVAGKERTNQLRLMVSTDRGNTWHSQVFPSEQGDLWYDLDFVASEDGRSQLAVLTGYVRSDALERPPRLKLYRSENGGLNWDAGRDLRDEAYDYSRVRNAKLIRANEGQRVFVLWEDWRRLRPELYGGYTDDFGANWVTLDARYSAQPEGRVGLQVLETLGNRGREGEYFVANAYVDDAYQKYKLHAVALKPEFASYDAPIAPAPEEAEAGLRERATRYWEAVVAKDWGVTYEMLDPYVRAVMSQDVYANRRGPINYSNVNIESVKFRGPVAEVRLKMDAEVVSTQMIGKPMNPPPPRKIQVLQRWLWIDGDWHYEYFEEFSDVRYAAYANR